MLDLHSFTAKVWRVNKDLTAQPASTVTFRHRDEPSTAEARHIGKVANIELSREAIQRLAEAIRVGCNRAHNRVHGCGTVQEASIYTDSLEFDVDGMTLHVELVVHFKQD